MITTAAAAGTTTAAVYMSGGATGFEATVLIPLPGRSEICATLTANKWNWLGVGERVVEYVFDALLQA